MTFSLTQQRAALAEIEQWIIARNVETAPELTRIDPDLDLIASGLINSLSFVELTFLIGKLAGRRPEVASLRADQFQTLNRISESFLGPA
jgi:acyl carrier protein